jgi:hypothetical protein
MTSVSVYAGVNDYYDSLAQEVLSQGTETFVNVNGKRSRPDLEDEPSHATTPDIGPTKGPIVHGAVFMSPLALVLTPRLLVKGKPMRYSEVKEEHHDLMTPEEYTEFYTVSESLGFM